MKEKILQFIGLQKPYNFVRLTVFIFVCSRVILYRFQPMAIEREIGIDLHLLDPQILQTNLLHGLFYLHSQAPLFNLFVGLLLKLNPFISAHIVAPAIYFCLGLFICLGSQLLLKILGASGRLAFTGGLAVMVFPPLALAERWLHFPYPLAALMLASCLLVYYFVKTRRFKYFVWLFGILCGMALMRGFFHLIFWILPIIILATIFIYKAKLPKKRNFIFVMAVFFLLSSSIYVRNYVMFGMFSSSTWQGINLAMTTHYVKKTDIQKMIDEKQITPLALIFPVSDPSVFYDYYRLKPKNQDPVLDSLVKSSGYPNYNNRIYPLASKEDQTNTIKIIMRYPGRYLMSVANEAYVFFGFFQYREFDNFSNWGRARVHNSFDKALLYITAYPLPLVMCLLFVWVVYWLVKKLKAGINFKTAANEQQAVYALVVFMSFNIVYTFGLAIAASAGEANFLRIPIDPLFVSMSVMLAGGFMAKKFNFMKFLEKEQKTIDKTA